MDPQLGHAVRHSSALLAQERQELLLSRFSLKKMHFSILIFSISSCIPTWVLECVFVLLAIRCYLIFLLWSSLEDPFGIRGACCTNPLASFRCSFRRQVILSWLHGLSSMYSQSCSGVSGRLEPCDTVKAQSVCLQGNYCRVRCHTWGVTWAGDSEIRQTIKTMLERYDLQLYPQRTLQANCRNIGRQDKQGCPAP